MNYDENMDIRMRLKVGGYKRGRTAFKPSDDMMRVAMYLLDLPEITYVKGFKCALPDVLAQAGKFFDSHFKLHNVDYISADDFHAVSLQFGSLSDKINSEHLLDLNQAIKAASRSVSPLELPVELVEGYSMKGDLIKRLALVDDEKFLEEQPIAFNGISLGNNITLLSAGTLIHEIVHSQLESVKGSCVSYHNKEVISIFMEKLAAYEMDPSGKLLAESEKIRNRDLLNNILILNTLNTAVDKKRLLAATVYVNSTLLADNLFARYISGDVDRQADILNGIQEVFDGKCTVEEFLEDRSVNFDNSVKSFCLRKRVKI